MNDCKFTGRFVKPIELRFIAGTGKAVANGTIAVDKKLSREQKQQFQASNKPTADFPQLVFWGANAENVAKYFDKGDPITIVRSRFETYTYQRQDGSQGYGTRFVVDEWEFPMGNNKQSTDAPMDTSDFIDITDSDESIPF